MNIDNRQDEEDPVWDLLKKGAPARPPVPDGFAQGLVEKARRTPQDPIPFRSRVVSPAFFAVPAAAAAAVALFIGVAPPQNPAPESGSPVAVEAPAAPAAPAPIWDVFSSELEELEEIDTLLAIQDVQALDDEAIGDLLF